MAHAGTPTDLAKRPATSTTNGLWLALLAVIVVVTIAVAAVMSTAFIGAGSAPAADSGYVQVEAARGAAPLSGARPDRRFDELVATPGTKTKLSGSVPDYGNGRIQGHRGAMTSR